MEENFPRGGVAVPATKRKAEQIVDDEDLFKTREAGLSASKKKKLLKETRDQERDAKKKKMKEAAILKTDATMPRLLLKKHLSPGMLVLGCVKAIYDFEVVVSLPNGVTGLLSITDISDAYTDMLRELTSDDGPAEDKNVASLQDLFWPGQVVRVKVKEVCGHSSKGESKKARASQVKLSVNPRDINSQLTGPSLKHGMVLTCAVASQEDHGYMLDLGVPGTSCFVKNAEVKKFITDNTGGTPLHVGQLLHCVVTSDLGTDSLHKRMVPISLDPPRVRKAVVKEHMALTLHTLIPGMVVEARITKVLEEGVNVRFLAFSGNIHASHLQKSTNHYNPQDKIKVALLHIDPTLKTMTLTQLSHLVTPATSMPQPFGNVQIGDTFDEGRVLKVDGGHGVIFALSKGVKGLATRQHLSDKEIQNPKDVFKKGQHHRCRVISLDYMDNIVMVTLRESVLNEPFIKISDLSPGQTIECEVTAFTPRGLKTKLSSHISGYIQNLHLSDVTLRHPEKKFSVGDKLKCKVLDTKPDKSLVYLTHKKSLVTSRYPVITAYNQCTSPGLITEGYVFRILDSGLTVRFYGDVQGFVPKSELSTEFIEFPDKVFYVGQVVRCQLIRADLQRRNLIFSLKVAGKASFGTKAVEVPEDFELGKLVVCKVSEKTDDGLNVTLLPSKMAAFLPTAHLSDNHGNCGILYSVYKKGDIIKNAMYLGKQNIILMTKKKSLQKSFQEHAIRTFDELVPGMLLPGVIKKKAEYGVFVDLGHGLIGLVPNRYISDKKKPCPSDLFGLGQSVVAKVTEVDKDKSRFLLSLRMSDCYHGELDDGLDLLAIHCEEYDVAMETLSKRKGSKANLAKYNIGKIVKVTVTEVTEEGVQCELQDAKIQGFISIDHLTGVACEVGDQLTALVLHIDAQNLRLELLADPKVVGHIKNFKDDKLSKVMESQVVKSTVLLIKETHILVFLRGRSIGRLAYLPAKRHPNDLFGHQQFLVGQENHVVIKRVRDQHPFCVLKVHDEEFHRLHPDAEEDEVEVGTIVKAQIVKVLHQQLNIQVGRFFGRVHITEVTDDPKKGVNPLSVFTKHEEIQVKVIGFRQISKEGTKYVSPPETKTERVLAECTLRQSKMNHKGLTQDDLVQEVTYSPGDHVSCYVTGVSATCVWMTVNPLWRGRIDIVDMTDEEAELSSFIPGNHYKATVISRNEKEHILDLTLQDHPAKIKANVTTVGRVTLVSRATGLSVELSQGYAGIVAPTDISDSLHDDMWDGYRLNSRVTCHILKCDRKQKRHCQLSLRPSRLHKVTHKSITDPEISSLDKLQSGKVLRGIVTGIVQSKGITISLGRGISGLVDHNHLSLYYIISLKAAFPLGKIVTVKIIRMKGSSLELSLLEADTGVPECIPEEQRGSRRAKDAKNEKRESTKRKAEDDGSSKRKKTSQVEEEEEDSGVDSDLDLQPQVLKLPSAAPRLSVSTKFSWDAATQPIASSSQTQFSKDNEDKDDDDDDADVTVDTKPRRKSKQEKMAEERLEELKLSEREQMLLSGEAIPQTTDDFDRVVLQSPDSSLVWLRYMAHYLETAETEKARGVAERALRTISFREEQERQNVWVAYLNLENMYGTEDSLKKVFSRALQNNDAIKITTQLIQIYTKSGNGTAADNLYTDLLKRHRGNKEVWVGYGSFLFRHGEADKARNLMQRSLKSLDKKDHVEVIAKFAQMEFRDGEAERGKTMFENVLSSYPKRTDLWSVYIDMITKLGELQPVRQLYERVINLNLSTKKMRFFFKKYLAFEERHGDEELVKGVKLKALEYVEAKTEQSSQ